MADERPSRLTPDAATGERPLRPYRRRTILRTWQFKAAVGLVLVMAGAAYGTGALRNGRGQGFGHAITQAAATALLGRSAVNILLIGNNARKASNPLDPGQADLSYLVHVEPSSDRAVFVAIPRDMMVAYPGWRDPIPKFKSAFLMGGPKLAMQVASRVTGLPVKYYVVTDFQGFMKAIDAVGGVTVRIPGELYDPMHSHAAIRPGVRRLTGSLALAYVRIRQNQAGNGMRTNDFERMRASYILLYDLRNKLLRHPSPGLVIRLYDAWSRDVATNLNRSQLIALALLAQHAHYRFLQLGGMADTMTFAGTTIPGVNESGQILGSDYDILSTGQIESVLRPFGAKNPRTGLAPLPAPASLHVAISNTVAGTELAGRLARSGIHVTLTSGVPGSGGVTQVLYPQGQLPAAEVVGRALAQADEQLVPAGVPQVEVEAG